MKLAYVEPTIEVKRYEISDVISTGASQGTSSKASDFQSVDDLVNDTDLSTTAEEPAVEENVDPGMGDVSESVDSFIAE